MTIDVSSGDVVENLAHAITAMARKIRGNTQKLTDLSASYYRFVPENLVQLLGETSIEKVGKSSYVEKDMTVLIMRFTFSDEEIQKSTGELFRNINNVIEHISPLVTENGGTVYDAQIVDKIVSPSGEIVVEKEPVVANRITGAADYLAAIQAGMQDVTDPDAGGTASSRFAKAKYAPAAKTGTAQRSDIDIENNSWLVTYAPKTGTPEIVVVVYIQNGYAGSYSSSTAIATIDYYLDSIYEKSDTLTVPQANTLAE